MHFAFRLFRVCLMFRIDHIWDTGKSNARVGLCFVARTNSVRFITCNYELSPPPVCAIQRRLWCVFVFMCMHVAVAIAQ